MGGGRCTADVGRRALSGGRWAAALGCGWRALGGGRRWHGGDKECFVCRSVMRIIADNVRFFVLGGILVGI